MTWTRLGDDFADRPAVMALTDAAFRAHIEALVWSNQQTTNGRLPDDGRTLRRILSADDVAAVVTELVKSGLWRVEADDLRVDWSEQETAERVQERRAFNTERQRRYRERSERHAWGDHSLCKYCKAGAGSRNALRNASDDASVTATRPVPSRPLGRDGEGSGSAASAGASTASHAEEENGQRRHLSLDDGSGISCWYCNLPLTHDIHSGSAELWRHAFDPSPERPALCRGAREENGEYVGCGCEEDHEIHTPLASGEYPSGAGL